MTDSIAPDTALRSMVEPLLQWYDENKRSLPWRDHPTPYHVWLSEIMLQQTRIEAVLPYYERFLAACPDVATLAQIDDDALMKLWQGLGYYSRARNLKKAAICIMEQHGGHFPADHAALLALPGVGDYTAGAIASIAFGLPEPAVDGNVLRVVMRLTGDEADVMQPNVKRRVNDALRQIYPRQPQQSAALTQAIMELGQRVCIPNGEVHCEHCPLGLLCRARSLKKTDTIPYRAPKKPRRQEKRTVLLLIADDGMSVPRVVVRKRPSQGLLSGLWEFPSLEGHLSPAEAQAAAMALIPGLSPGELMEAPTARHIFTHVEWHMHAYLMHVSLPVLPDDTMAAASQMELTERYAIPSAYRAYLQLLPSLLGG